ncbi:MAG: hypothetical protein GX195_07385 [Firmicutes bacterium]|nr:hypothetical protein [Bacillota bacterium]
MREENWLSMALIVLGGFLLLRNLGVIPFIRWGVVWPLALIGLGIWALAKGVQRPQQKEVIINGERVYTADGESSPLLRLLAGVVVAVTLGLVCLIVFGFVAPFVVLFIPLLPIILFLKLGAAFLRILLSFAIFGAPILLIILLLALLL